MGCCQGNDRVDQYGRTSMKFSTVSSITSEKYDSMIEKESVDEIESPFDLQLERSKYSNIEYLQIVLEKVKKDEDLAPVLSKDAIAEILQNINKGSQAIREQSVLFLFEIVKFSNRVINNRIVKAGGLKVLVRWLQCESDSFRMNCMEVCYYLYKNNKNNQNEFIQIKGHLKLVQLLAWSIKNHNQLERTLIYIEALMSDANKKTRVIVCEKLFDAMIWDVLNTLPVHELPDSVGMRAKKLKIKIAEHLIQ